MTPALPAALPAAHRAFIARALAILPADPRIVGLAAAGSFLTGVMDEFSDLDLIVVSTDQYHADVLRQREAIARSLGPYLAGFTGEHVGEPRLLIALYDAPLLHVDLKFVSIADAHQGVEEPAVLWERDCQLTAALLRGQRSYPQPDLEWIEARFWIWMHYGTTKIGRGELYEAIEFISFVRSTVLGPLALQRAGVRPQGVRRIETADPAFAQTLNATVPSYDAASCKAALMACVELYRGLRASFQFTAANAVAEHAVLQYVSELKA